MCSEPFPGLRDAGQGVPSIRHQIIRSFLLIWLGSRLQCPASLSPGNGSLHKQVNDHPNREQVKHDEPQLPHGLTGKYGR